MSTKALGDLPAGATLEDIERNLQDITRAINGNDTNGIAFNLTQHDSSSTYALSVTNIETGNSKTASISTAGDTEHIIVDKSGLNFKGVASFTGNTTITGTLDVTSDFRVATSKFTVTAATGNTAVAGTLGVTGNFAVATNKFAVDAATGNTIINTNKVSIDGATGAQTNAGPFTAALGTLTADANCIAATATWNSGGTTFSGAVKVVVTDTASAAASKLMDLFIGATSKFSIQKDGLITTTGQISFPATQNASSDANTLDDYEEWPSWTPSLGGTATYTARSGSATKIGNLVFWRLSITVNAIGTGSTTVVSGLPYTPAVNTAGEVGYYDTAVSAFVMLKCYANTSGNVAFVGLTAGSTNIGAPALFGAGTTVFASGCFQV